MNRIQIHFQTFEEILDNVNCKKYYYHLLYLFQYFANWPCFLRLALLGFSLGPCFLGLVVLGLSFWTMHSGFCCTMCFVWIVLSGACCNRNSIGSCFLGLDVLGTTFGPRFLGFVVLDLFTINFSINMRMESRWRTSSGSECSNQTE